MFSVACLFRPLLKAASASFSGCLIIQAHVRGRLARTHSEVARAAKETLASAAADGAAAAAAMAATGTAAKDPLPDVAAQEMSVGDDSMAGQNVDDWKELHAAMQVCSLHVG